MSISRPTARGSLWCCAWLAAGLDCLSAAQAPVITLPDFPLPVFATDNFGSPVELSSIRMLRELHNGGVRGMERFEAVDSSYAMVSSSSLGLFAAWLETACRALGVDVTQARKSSYDGAAYARLLGTATGIAAARKSDGSLAVPVGVMICLRRKSWGALPADGERDAYVVVATERGILVYDPPTRQTSLLADHPNNADVVMIVF